jgi:hypothetical protein
VTNTNKVIALSTVPVFQGRDYDLLVLTEKGDVWITRDFENWSLVKRGDFPVDKGFWGSSPEKHYINKRTPRVP